MRPGEELKDGPPIHGNTRLEVLWTALPAVLLIGLVSYSFVMLHENEKKPAGKPEVQIGGDRPAVLLGPSNTRLGHRRQAAAQLSAVPAQGLHGLLRHALQGRHPRLLDPGLPPAGGRRAGITTHYRSTLDRLGTYPIVCNLLCGVGHSLMRSTVHVVTPARFEAWLKSQAEHPGRERLHGLARACARHGLESGGLRDDVSAMTDAGAR